MKAALTMSEILGASSSKTLLEKARATGRKMKAGTEESRDELLDLALAFYASEITGAQANAALGKDPYQYHSQSRLSSVLRDAIRRGEVTPPRRVKL